MEKHRLTPQARRAEETSRARAQARTRKIEEIAPLWQIAALVGAGIVLLALI